jgi:hypothetical protein
LGAEDSQTHPFSEGVNGFEISPRMQALITNCRQLDSYEKSHEIRKDMLQIQVSENRFAGSLISLFTDKTKEKL